MLVQIYEVMSPEEAGTLAELGVDHIGVLVGEGEFPREQSLSAAKRIFAAIPPRAKGSALSLSAHSGVIARIVEALSPPILHLGASTELLKPEHVVQLKKDFTGLCIMRSIPVVDEGSIAVARSYDGIADMLLLDPCSGRQTDRCAWHNAQLGA
jgi:phosphoribosylanthranilate isomerase